MNRFRMIVAVLIGTLAMLPVACDNGSDAGYSCESASDLFPECPTLKACCSYYDCYYRVDDLKFECDGTDCVSASDDVVNHCIQSTINENGCTYQLLSKNNDDFTFNDTWVCGPLVFEKSCAPTDEIDVEEVVSANGGSERVYSCEIRHMSCVCTHNGVAVSTSEFRFMPGNGIQWSDHEDDCCPSGYCSFYSKFWVPSPNSEDCELISW